jgi:hypothetical protein
MLRRKSTESKHLWLPVFALFVTTCAVVINVIQGMFGYPFHETTMLEGQKFVSIQGFAYAAPLPAEYSPGVPNQPRLGCMKMAGLLPHIRSTRP